MTPSLGQYDNFPKIGIGVDLSAVRGYTNLNTQYTRLAYNISFVYSHSKYIITELELQKGQLSGGGLTVDVDRYGRRYTNNYLNFLLHTDVQLGTIIDLDNTVHIENLYGIFKNIYLGAGGGVIFNNNKVQRTNVISANGPLTYVFPGDDVSKNGIINLRAGYLLHINDDFGNQLYCINFAFINNICLGNGLDGYNDPRNIFQHRHFELYNQFTIGFKYFFN
ncbi:MAG: hypothetical protein ACXVA1_22590 [Mucilaginibacter sp.]